jgi:fructose-bisphosphate aldolase class I
MTDEKRLEATAKALVTKGKGILAVDESNATCTRRFAELGIESTEDSRQAYREMLFTALGIGNYITGVIMYDETFRQNAAAGRPLREVLTSSGIMPGIKVDTGAKPLAKAPGETITEGLDGLRERLEEYRAIGARFTKWRAAFQIGAGLPSDYCIATNAQALGRYAALVQEAGLVPIVEPEVLRDGDHDIYTCQEVTEKVLHRVFAELTWQRCHLEGMILKPSMVTAGKANRFQAPASEVAELTLQTLRRCVPAAVPGIAFLSGGQTGEEACDNLSAMVAHGNHPWPLTFSFARALQYPALEIWDGKAANVPAAQSAFLHRAEMATAASLGRYSREAERQFSLSG